MFACRFDCFVSLRLTGLLDVESDVSTVFLARSMSDFVLLVDLVGDSTMASRTAAATTDAVVGTTFATAMLLLRLRVDTIRIFMNEGI